MHPHLLASTLLASCLLTCLQASDVKNPSTPLCPSLSPPTRQPSFIPFIQQNQDSINSYEAAKYIKMTSNPPAQCCTVGVKHDGKPTGKSSKIGPTDVYIAEPTGSNIHDKTAILFLPDVIGIWQNSQLMADQFAANGYYTLVIDQFNGDPMKINRPADFDFAGWLNHGSDGKNPHTLEHVEPVVESAIKYLKDAGFTKIGSVGYCFGAKYTVRGLAAGKGIDVGYLAHPSFVTEEELRNIKGPLSIAAAETDSIFTKEQRHDSERILSEVGQKYQINLYGGVEHGFSIRGDVSIPHKKFAKEQAFLQAVAWFNAWLI